MIVRDIFNIDTKGKSLVIGLGYFDTVHSGHKHLINRVVELSRTLSAIPAIFTFFNNPFTSLGSDTKSVFDFEERQLRLEALGIEEIIGANFDEKFSSLSGEDFLSLLTNHFNIRYAVSGSDFCCGKKAHYSVNEIGKYLSEKNIGFESVNLVERDGVKISSRDIRSMLIDGDIERVNSLLSQPYAITDTVVEGRHDGRRIGFPTVNIAKKNDCIVPKDGVYATIVTIDGVKYKGVTNVGIHPTFNDFSRNVETHIIGFNEEIYGKDIRIEFVKRLRDVMKFDSVDGLVKQISCDREKVIREVEI